jgi:hypothetical protein
MAAVVGVELPGMRPYLDDKNDFRKGLAARVGIP